MYDFKEIEEKAGKILNKKDIAKAIKNDGKRKKTFSFLEGPPTANAPPALHHLEVRTYKDIINKFKYMQGFNVPRKAGWDCHGLPVEVQIEKKLKLNSKKDILKYGEAKFINDCRESVFSYIKEWDKSTEKLNYWIDLENPYVTLQNDYIESVWWSLKQLYDKKMLYEAHKVVPFCPRCETPLSSHEVAQGYRKIKEDSLIVKFKLVDDKASMLVFTTTPWTLPSNLAVAVNPNFEYAYVRDEEDESGEVYVIAKDLMKNYFKNPHILKTVKGETLLGKKYEPLFNHFKKEKAFWIIGGDFVVSDEGTGLVHMAPAFGEVDYDACKTAGLPFVQPVDDTGHFTNEIPEYQGRFIKDCDKDIIIRLKKEGKLFKMLKYEHDYPFCWRCDTPLMYYAIKSWFVKVTAYKDRLIELNDKKINWVPKHIKDGRFGEWLRNVKDWALSRKKFWGTPLPIWRCSCGNEVAIGSVDELKKKSVLKFSDKEIDLHKPWIEGIKLKCDKCKKEMTRVPDVIDCWYDSGSAAFAQFHYPFENKEEFRKRFPYDFISEGIDQTRGWFYTMHVLATMLFDDVAYKNVVCAGHIVDEKGDKMSKSKGNILNPDEMFNTVGVDATRMQFCIFDIGSSKRFGVTMVKQGVLPFLNVLWNIAQYYEQQSPSKKGLKKIEDKWIISRLNSTIKETTSALESYQIEKGLAPLMDFVVNDFSKTYIKIVRDREDEQVKKVIAEVLEAVVKMLAPYAPNITEVIYKNFSKKGESVHLSSWPKLNEKKIQEGLEAEFKHMMKIIEMSLAKRDQAKMGIRWPLSKVTVFAKVKLPVKTFGDIIKSQLNVKEIEFKTAKETELEVELDLNMTPELEAEGYAREISRKVQAGRKTAGLKKENMIDAEILVDRDLLEMLKDQKNYLKERINAKNLLISESKKELKGFKHVFEEKIKEKSVKIGFNVQ